MKNNGNNTDKDKTSSFIRNNLLLKILLFILIIVAVVGILIKKQSAETFEKTVIIGENVSDSDLSSTASNPSTLSYKSVNTNTSIYEQTSTLTTSKVTTAPNTSQTTSNITKTANSTSKVTLNFPMEINSVSKGELMAINGIGEKTAEKIITYRHSVGIIYNMDLLLNIEGIGDKTLENLKNYLYVDENYYKNIPETTSEKITPASSGILISSNESKTLQTSTATVKTTISTTQTTCETEPPQLKKVNVNKASAEKISECLLIDLSTAQNIVDIREKINGYTNVLELLYADGISESLLSSLINYIEL